jgi:GAF domain-containing protein
LRSAHTPDLIAELDRLLEQNGDNAVLRAGRGVVEQGIRCGLWVPMVKDDTIVGAFVLNRTEPRPFTDAQIELVETFASQAVIAIENARLLDDLNARNRDLSELLEQQRATSDILRAIATTPGDAERVMQVIAENAGRLCEAMDVNIYLPIDGKLRMTVSLGTFGALGPVELPIGPGSVCGTAFTERRAASAVHMEKRSDEFPDVPTETARRVPSVLAVPMLRNDEALGVIVVVRGEAQPFSEAHGALLASFADQAVIAIENARLLSELNERNQALSDALRRQTALAEVLRVIAGAPSDVDRVFDTITEVCLRLFGAWSSGIARIEDGVIRHISVAGDTREGAAVASLKDTSIDRNTATGRSILDKRTVHVEDIQAQSGEFPDAPAVRSNTAVRTIVATPLLREGEPIGGLNVTRAEVRPFTPEQLELLETLANQAVIAIENARLLSELRDSLERRTATAEVLAVISSSPGEVQPVFEAMLENAVRLCDADNGSVFTASGGMLRRVASRGELDRLVGHDEVPMTPGTPPGRIRETLRSVHTPDLAAALDRMLEQHGDNDTLRAGRAVVAQGIRCGLWVPMVKDDTIVGAFVLNRTEARPFAESQIELVETFASQAVIAIENARLLSELREALERRTATAEVLSVISSSPGDVQPVFETMLDKAIGICDAVNGAVYMVSGDTLRQAVSRWVTGNEPATGKELPFPPGSFLDRMRSTLKPVHVPDLLTKLDARTETSEDDPAVAASRAVAGQGVQSILWVPMVRDKEVVGAFVFNRIDPNGFAEAQIELVETFASQAVIAIENARLLSELHEALERRTATADVLAVISSSPGDVQPVFETMLDKAVAICGASEGSVFTYADGVFLRVASRGLTEGMTEYREIPARPDTPPGEVVRTRKTVHMPDLRRAGEKDGAFPGMNVGRVVVERGGRSGLWVPMIKDGEVVGAFTLIRRVVGPFSDNQIGLVENFASQAVIAIENARLLSELRESLERRTATADVLAVISSSPGEVQPVFEAMLENAVRLCDAGNGSVFTASGDVLHRVANLGLTGNVSGHNELPLTPGTHPARMRDTLKSVHVPDFLAELEELSAEHGDEPAVQAGQAAAQLGIRSVLWVPMVKDKALVGAFVLNRSEARPFTDAQIDLVETFASQAVIAIENARLLEELRESLENQTASADILRVISSSAADTQPVFDAIVEAGLRLFGGDTVAISLPDGDQVRVVAIDDHDWKRAENWRSRFPVPLSRDYMNGVCILDRRAIDIDDVTETPGEYLPGRQNFLAGGYRAVTMLPMLRGDEAIGTISIVRVAPGPLTDKQRDLLKTFADQAVIAIENARLLEELRAARDAAERAVDELREAQASLIHAEKMASLGQLTAGIAHEIKNPLNFVNNFAGLSVELLDELKETAGPAFATLSGEDRADVDEVIEMLTGNLEKVAEHGKRADGIVKSMLAHSRGGGGERQTVDLNALIEESLNLAYHGARAQDQNFNITMEREFDPALRPIEVVPQDLTRVFLNLFGNGFYAANKRARESGEADFRPVLEVGTRGTDDGVEIRIRDNGTGIPAELQERLFEPFFTTKPTGEGTGLGLSISYEIVTKQHGGAIAVESVPGEFTEFRITLPRQARG